MTEQQQPGDRDNPGASAGGVPGIAPKGSVIPRKGGPTTTPRTAPETASPAENWRYSVDPAYDSEGYVPPFAIRGAWQIYEHGESGEFVPNPDYRPSPQAMGLPEATDPVDAAMQLAATGHGPESAVLDALRDAVVYLVPEPDADPLDLPVYVDEEGSFVPVLTHPLHAPPIAPQVLPVGWAALLATLNDDTGVKINPGGAVSLRLSVTTLRTALESPRADG